MNKKFFISLLIICFSMFNVMSVNGADTTISATLENTEPVVSGGGGAGLGAGGIVGIATGTGGGVAAAGAGAFAFAPILLAGLDRNSSICAAAPLEYVQDRATYLEEAIKIHGGVREGSKDKIYFAQNDCEIINGTFDIDEFKLPKDFLNGKIKIKVTIASQPYKEVDGDPEFTLGIYKDISFADISKKFETQQFMRHYLMKKYDVPLKITTNNYNGGVQQLEGVLDMSKVQKPNDPIEIVVRYMVDGFSRNLKEANPKVLTYAYLIEFEK